MATLRSGAGVYKIFGLAEAEFPGLPAFDGAVEFKLKSSDLKDALRKTHYAISLDETRSVLNGSLFSFKGHKLTPVATDGTGSLRAPLFFDLSLVPKDASERAILAFPADAIGGYGMQVLELQVSLTALDEGEAGTLYAVLPNTGVQRLQGADGSRFMRFSGTGAALEAWLAGGGLRQQSPGENVTAANDMSLGLRLVDASGQVTDHVVAIKTTRDPAGPAGRLGTLALTLPRSVTVVSGADSPLKLGTDRIAYTGTQTLELRLTTSAGVLAGAAGAGVSIATQTDPKVPVASGSADSLDAWMSDGWLTLLTGSVATVRGALQ